MVLCDYRFDESNSRQVVLVFLIDSNSTQSMGHGYLRLL